MTCSTCSLWPNALFLHARSLVLSWLKCTWDPWLKGTGGKATEAFGNDYSVPKSAHNYEQSPTCYNIQASNLRGLEKRIRRASWWLYSSCFTVRINITPNILDKLTALIEYFCQTYVLLQKVHLTSFWKPWKPPKSAPYTTTWMLALG